MNKLTKRLLSLLLSMLMISTLTTSVSAEGLVSGISNTPQENPSASLFDEIEDEDLRINEEVAHYVAEFFVSDMINTGETIWNDNTAITETVVMYDETGEIITGYTFKLTDGYVVVSAYLDVPSIILEWADEADPYFENADIDEDENVVYLGALDYYIDDGTDNLETIDGIEVGREELSNGFEELRDIENVEESMLEEIVEAKEIATPPGISLFANTWGDYITDVFTYARNVYGGAWSASSWKNLWENEANFATLSNFERFGYREHCGPVAITNIIKMYGKKYNNSTINANSDLDVFNKAVSHDGFYENGTGTIDKYANTYIENCFADFNVNVSVYGQYPISYQNTVNAVGITAQRLMYIMLHSSGHPYGDHAVVGYAYNRLVSNSGTFKSFIKICDGKFASPRYIEIGAVSSNKYWEVYFG